MIEILLNLKSIPSHLKEIVLQTAIKFGNEKDWLDLYEFSLITKSPSEKFMMHTALTYTQDYNLLEL